MIGKFGVVCAVDHIEHDRAWAKVKRYALTNIKVRVTRKRAFG